MIPKDMHALRGRVIALVLANGTLSAGIRWRIYGCGGSALWLRSVDSGTVSKLPFAEFRELCDAHRIEVCKHDPLPDILIRGRRHT